MCGICGEIGLAANPATVSAASSKLAHRGPDQSGIVQKGEAVLAHRRLSILDLSDAGRQPMSNEDGSVWLVFNGEIYNFAELRRELEPFHRFHSKTDSEVLVHGYEQWGIDGLLRRIRGMFAFAIWDCKEETLYLARDHFGKKPLFYAPSASGIAFASTIPALLELMGKTPGIVPQSVSEFLNLRYVPAPGTIFNGVFQLCPASYLRFSRKTGIDVREYWTLKFGPKLDLSENEWLEQIGAELERSVKERLVADVRVGTFLSGGIDSSVIAALMMGVSGKPPLTITMGFEQKDFDESNHGRVVARHLGAEHHECSFSPALLDALPDLVWHFGQPFADPAALPTYYLARYAAKYVKVVTTGDGGDEAFAGYPTIPAARMAQRLRAIPGVRSGRFAQALAWLESAGVGAARSPRWIAEVARGLDGRYLQDPVGRSNFQNYRNLLGPALTPGARDHDWAWGYRESWSRFSGEDWADRALGTDILTLLPNALLTKLDAMTMASAIEARSPFLDLGLMELCARIPSSRKLPWLRTKHLLKRLGLRWLPQDILVRKKQAFSVPLDHWFRTELKTCARGILQTKAARDRGILNPDVVASLLAAHESGQANHGRRLWLALMLELWCRMFLDRDIRPSDSLSAIPQADKVMPAAAIFTP